MSWVTAGSPEPAGDGCRGQLVRCGAPSSKRGRLYADEFGDVHHDVHQREVAAVLITTLRLLVGDAEQCRLLTRAGVAIRTVDRRKIQDPVSTLAHTTSYLPPSYCQGWV